MEFGELTKEEFTTFAKNHSQASFHQTISWGNLKEENGWKSHYVGVKKGKKVIAASLILSKKIPIFPKNMFYAPRGFLIDYNNLELLEFFTKGIKDYAKKNNAIFVKIDPYLSYQERDVNGDIVPDGENNFKAYENLKKLKYKHLGFSKMQEDLQPRWIFVTPTKDTTPEEMLQRMDRETRRILYKNERNKVKVREASYDEIPKFKDIMENTTDRRNFIDRPLSYYQNMYKHMSEEGIIKLLIAEVNTDEVIEEYKTELDKVNDDIKQREIKYNENPEKMSEKKYNEKLEANKKEVARLEKNINHIKELKEKNGTVITLGGIMFMDYGNEFLSLVGGSYGEFMEFQSAYTIHYEGIKYAIEHNYDRYNFYGITGDFNPKNPLYGLYSFKKDFSGKVVELIGEFDLIINPVFYRIYKISFKLYRFLKNIKK